jgi:hypothetical protein
MYHVYSTMSSDNEYVRYSEHGPQGVNIAERSVLIKGGSGANRKNFGTPLGVYTSVSDEDFEWLKEDYSFKRHMNNGYITVQKSKVDPEVAAADMTTRNQKTDACPLVPQDFSDKPAADGLTAIEPKTNKKKAA